MYGWRARIGLVIPANNNVLEPELYRVAPEGVSFHASRMLLGSADMSPEMIVRMERNADRALRELAETDVGTAVYACMSTSIVKGKEWDEGFRQRLQQIAPTVRLQSVAAAHVLALRHLGLHRVAVATPYPPSVSALVPAYFAAWDVEVVDQVDLPTADVRAVCKHPPSTAYRLARQLARATERADGVAILATDFRTLEVIEPLETDLGCPVVSTNQALLWWALRTSGVRESLPGLGSLLRSGARSDS